MIHNKQLAILTTTSTELVLLTTNKPKSVIQHTSTNTSQYHNHNLSHPSQYTQNRKSHLKQQKNRYVHNSIKLRSKICESVYHLQQHITSISSHMYLTLKIYFFQFRFIPCKKNDYG